MVHYNLQLTHWVSYCTLPPPIDPLVIFMEHYYFLVALWISYRCTSLSYWPTGYIYGTLLLTHWISLWYTTLSYWPTGYLYGTLLFYWPSGYLRVALPSPIGPLYISLVRYLTTGFPCGKLLSSTGPMTISIVHYPLLLAYWISL